MPLARLGRQPPAGISAGSQLHNGLPLAAAYGLGLSSDSPRLFSGALAIYSLMTPLDLVPKDIQRPYNVVNHTHAVTILPSDSTEFAELVR